MSLRGRLEAKRRRHLDYRVVIDDSQVAAALAAVQVAGAELLAAQVAETAPQLLAARQDAVAAAQAALQGCFEVVGFDAMDPDEYDALVTAHADPTTGDPDRATLLPVLAAECAVDQGLADPTWWVARLVSGTWSSGELDDLYHALYLLNRTAPGAVGEALGKG